MRSRRWVLCPAAAFSLLAHSSNPFMMATWRMQLHPDDSESSRGYAESSLRNGLIGLDFREDVGDLMRAKKEDLPESQKLYYDFAHKMKIGDRVLIMAGFEPLALVTVEGEYTYISRKGELGVWFRHFRRVGNVQYAKDRAPEKKRIQLTMRKTIEHLVRTDTESYNFIENW